MTEKLLQYIWQFGYFNHDDLKTVAGETLSIDFAGRLNNNQGPDFLQAKILIDKTLLAGSVELHLNTSDWAKHNHSSDPNYKNVILHVVLHHDVDHDSNIPVLELQPRIPNILLQRYERLMNNTAFIACTGSISNVKELTWTSWKERLLAERLSAKAERLIQFLKRTNFHWEEAFWWLLCRNFGSTVNSDAFEALAQSIPLNLLAKHKNQIHQLEALLFGQAGMLDKNFIEDYPQLLKKEYAFLKNKYKLKPIPFPMHTLRMRPGNFPALRLAQLAMLIHSSNHLFSKIIEVTEVKEIVKMLSVTANDYWHYHYRFDEESGYKQKRLGDVMSNNLIINTVIPSVFAYGLYHNKEQTKLKALRWLEQTKPESNNITKGFAEISIANKSSYDSQALIQLKNEYCNKRSCLECAIGNALLKTI
jgi:hypothetical protein